MINLILKRDFSGMIGNQFYEISSILDDDDIDANFVGFIGYENLKGGQRFGIIWTHHTLYVYKNRTQSYVNSVKCRLEARKLRQSIPEVLNNLSAKIRRSL